MSPILTQLPEDIIRQETVVIIKKYLCEKTYTPISFCEEVTLKEGFDTQTTWLSGELCLGSGAAQRVASLSGCGKGPVDALFNSFYSQFAPDYSFLDFLHLREFKVDTLRAPHPYLRTDALALATIIVQIEDRHAIAFRREARSLIEASLQSTLTMFEYFINAQATMTILKKLVKDYKERNRGDLYDQALSDLVNLNRCAYYKEQAST